MCMAGIVAARAEAELNAERASAFLSPGASRRAQASQSASGGGRLGGRCRLGGPHVSQAQRSRLTPAWLAEHRAAGTSGVAVAQRIGLRGQGWRVLDLGAVALQGRTRHLDQLG